MFYGLKRDSMAVLLRLSKREHPHSLGVMVSEELQLHVIKTGTGKKKIPLESFIHDTAQRNNYQSELWMQCREG